MKKGFTLIVPVYNETTRLTEGLAEILVFLQGQKDPWELLIVDDGSTIPAQEIAQQIQQLKKEKRVRFIRLSKNQGKGAAIARGVTQSQFEHILFTDIDCSVPLTFLPSFRHGLDGHDVVIASRRLPRSRIVVHQTKLRESAGWIYTMVSNALCGIHVSDATCGFKAYRNHVAKRLFSRRRINRWAFDTEVLYLARKYHYSITERAVFWSNRTGSRVKLSDSLGSFRDVLTIPFRSILGVYS